MSQREKSSILPFLIALLILAVAGGVAWWWFDHNEQFATGNDSADAAIAGYNQLTGLPTANTTAANTTFCVQIPNGSTDGARPQAGLTHAGVVFEAIAETGITRFAAVFSGDTTTGVIGPIRSLRPYYLDWDTPFDCTIVHDGGSDEALTALKSGSYRDLDEDFDYMWKDDDPSRLWNNVFTSPSLLLQFNRDQHYGISDLQAFPRLTPDEAATQTADATDHTECLDATECVTDRSIASDIHVAFTSLRDYMTDYHYDASTNTYLRSYGSDESHLTYDCPDGETDFSRCELVQVTPSAIAIIRVRENTMSDDYHEQIQTTGSGTAYIFQNGTVIEGSWQKSSVSSQIEFTDAAGNEVKFTPGQLWIAAVPQFGSVSWD